MEKLSKNDLARKYAASSQKWCVLIGGFEVGFSGESFKSGESTPEQITKAAPYLSFDSVNHDDMEIIFDGWGLIVCDSREEAWEIFDRTRGDHLGKLNKYRGKCKIYALIIGPNGQAVSENT